MRRQLRNSLVCAALFLLPCSASSRALVAPLQEPEQSQSQGASEGSQTEPHFPTKEEVLQGGPGQASPEDHMRELFLQVERNLQSIDRLLGDAAAGDTSSLTDVESAGIASLLQSSLERGREAQEKILEIIEIARQQGASSSSSSSGSSGKDKSNGPGSPSSSGQEGSPLDRGQQSQSTEQTPQMGGQESGGETPAGQQEGGQEPQQSPAGKPQECQGGTDPERGDESGGDGQNRTDGQDSGSAAGRTANDARAAAGWGDLPSHVRETFNSAGRSELPARYRDWIDDYYRKLNRRRDR